MLGTVAARAVIRMIEKVKMDNPVRNNGSTSASGNTSMTAVLHRLTAMLTHENEILESTNDADHANYIIAKKPGFARIDSDAPGSTAVGLYARAVAALA